MSANMKHISGRRSLVSKDQVSVGHTELLAAGSQIAVSEMEGTTDAYLCLPKSNSQTIHKPIAATPKAAVLSRALPSNVAYLCFVLFTSSEVPLFEEQDMQRRNVSKDELIRIHAGEQSHADRMPPVSCVYGVSGVPGVPSVRASQEAKPSSIPDKRERLPEIAGTISNPTAAVTKQNPQTIQTDLGRKPGRTELEIELETEQDQDQEKRNVKEKGKGKVIVKESREAFFMYSTNKLTEPKPSAQPIVGNRSYLKNAGHHGAKLEYRHIPTMASSLVRATNSKQGLNNPKASTNKTLQKGNSRESMKKKADSLSDLLAPQSLARPPLHSDRTTVPSINHQFLTPHHILTSELRVQGIGQAGGPLGSRPPGPGNVRLYHKLKRITEGQALATPGSGASGRPSGWSTRIPEGSAEPQGGGNVLRLQDLKDSIRDLLLRCVRRESQLVAENQKLKAEIKVLHDMLASPLSASPS